MLTIKVKGRKRNEMVKGKKKKSNSNCPHSPLTSFLLPRGHNSHCRKQWLFDFSATNRRCCALASRATFTKNVHHVLLYKTHLKSDPICWVKARIQAEKRVRFFGCILAFSYDSDDNSSHHHALHIYVVNLGKFWSFWDLFKFPF